MQKTPIWHFRFFVIIFIGLFSGCWFTQQPESADNGSVSAVLLYSGVSGVRTMKDASALWITNRKALEDVFSALSRRQIEDGDVLLDIDFDRYGVLYLEMGQKPTGGYSIDFIPSLSRVIDKQAFINISWNTPGEGVFLTQAVTSPFILIKICRADITSIVVVDQDEQPLFELSIE